MADAHTVVARLCAVLGARESDPVPLPSGLTGRNWFRVRLGGSEYVFRLPPDGVRPVGTDPDAECRAQAAAGDMGLAPPVVATLGEPPVLVTRYVPGRAAEADELRRPAAIRALAGPLRRFHDSGLELPARYDSFEVADEYAAVARRHGAELPAGLGRIQATARAIRGTLRGPLHAPVPCHNDLAPDVFSTDGERIQIVDWQFAGMGDRWFDLANFAANNALDEAAESLLLELYFGEPPDARELATLRVMRFMSDLDEAMWGFAQEAASDLNGAAGGHARRHFERLAERAADPRLRGWISLAGASRA